MPPYLDLPVPYSRVPMMTHGAGLKRERARDPNRDTTHARGNFGIVCAL